MELTQTTHQPQPLLHLPILQQPKSRNLKKIHNTFGTVQVSPKRTIFPILPFTCSNSKQIPLQKPYLGAQMPSSKLPI